MKLHENQKIEENEKQLSKVPKLDIMNLKMLYNVIRGSVFKLGNTHQIKLMRYA